MTQQENKIMRQSTKVIACIGIMGPILAACGTGDNGPATAVEPNKMAAVAPQAPATDAAAAAEIMNKPMDGSSPEAFKQGLNEVKAVATPQDYKRLESALNSMLFYDLSVAGDKARLYEKLDGLSPNEIMVKAAR
jgi:hypothetical protein